VRCQSWIIGDTPWLRRCPSDYYTSIAGLQNVNNNVNNHNIIFIMAIFY